MKKILSVILITITCVLICACDPSGFVVDRNSLDDVISIELVEYKNSNQKHFTSWVPNHFNELLPFSLNNVTIIESLPADKIPEFLDSFSKTDILHTYYAYNSPKGVCIKLNYKNGGFLIVWANYEQGRFGGYIGEYSSSGAVLSFWGSFSALSYYEELVNDYFNYNLQ